MKKGTAGIQLTNDYDTDIALVRVAGKIISGMIVGPVTAQNQALLLFCHPGMIKEQPTLGAGIDDLLLNEEVISVRRRIEDTLRRDGQVVEVLNIKDKVTLKANYI